MDAPPPFARHLERPLVEALSDTPIVVLQGARQVGKSTLAARLATQRPAVLVTLDDPVTLAVAESDPGFFVSQAPDRLVIIDEAQRAPGLILPLKASVDRDRRPGRFLLTGSVDLLQVAGVGDSLAGRAESFELGPLSQGELARREIPEDFVAWLLTAPEFKDFEALDPALVVAGGYPEVQLRSPRRARAWFESYARRLAGHDARDLRGGGFPDHLYALLAVVAAGPQHEVVRVHLARDLGVSENTAESYLRTAMAMRLVSTLQPWGRNLRGRVTRRPKVSLNDTGFAAALTGFSESHATTLGGREYFGALVEQFAAIELDKQRAWSSESYRTSHYRDTDGLEVDQVIELADGRLVAVEVKAAIEVTAKSWRNLERFRSRFADREVIGVCLYGGTRAWRVHDWLSVLPITALWQH
ncbi:MAG: ATP-binding protein [Actinobacteria bacterium]|nr:ATP-binding protein [Actinomycetota bacterium]